MSDAGDEPVGTFAIHFAEGECLAKQGQFAKAIESYTRALDLQPDEISCLVARSKCYLQLGEVKLALEDAEDSLKENKLYHKGLYQKAEVLYSKGDFEHALMYYHRGHKIRPELREFVLGIQKAQEAVNNSVGTPDACKLEKIGDLSFFQQQDNLGKKKKKLNKPMLAVQQKKERREVASEKTIKELLGEVYPDREYLAKLMDDTNLTIGRKDRSIYKTVEEALIYLDARTEFWRQQKPMYARKREKELNRYKPAPTKPIVMGLTAPKETMKTKEILKKLEDIDNDLANGDAEISLQKAEKLMRGVEILTETDLPGKAEFRATLHSCIGNAQLELGEAEMALAHHLKDLEIAENLDNKEMVSRALDNVGRVYAVMGKFKKASEYWARKVPLVTSDEESAWLHHELGRCQLELGNYQEAMLLGHKALESADQASDHMWQLNASMLMAQAQSRMNDFDSAVENFERALALAKLLEDDATRDAIVKAMEDVREKITRGLKEGEGEGEGEGAKESGKEEEEGSGEADAEQSGKEAGKEEDGDGRPTEDENNDQEKPEEDKDEVEGVGTEEKEQEVETA